MKVLIAIALIVLWLFFPAGPLVRRWHRWQAKREAGKYSQMLFK
jgi:hypothetical protein